MHFALIYAAKKYLLSFKSFTGRLASCIAFELLRILMSFQTSASVTELRVILSEETVLLERNGLAIFQKGFIFYYFIYIINIIYEKYSFLAFYRSDTHLFLCFWNKRVFITLVLQKAISHSTTNHYCFKNVYIKGAEAT